MPADADCEVIETRVVAAEVVIAEAKKDVNTEKTDRMETDEVNTREGQTGTGEVCEWEMGKWETGLCEAEAPEMRKANLPSEWIACSRCGKWRRLSSDKASEALRFCDWHCEMSGDADRNTCDKPQEEWDEEEWCAPVAAEVVSFDNGYPVEPAPHVAVLLAAAIEKGGGLTAAGILSSAGLISECVGCFLHVFKQKVSPNAEPAVIPQAAGTMVEGARCVATAALGLTSCVGESVAAAAAVVGAAAAERVAVVSRQSMTSAAMRTLGNASLSALTEVYEAVEMSSRQLASSGVVAASDAVSHRYGGNAGRVTHDAFAAVGSATQAAMHISSLGRKSLARVAAKSAAKAAVAATSFDDAALLAVELEAEPSTPCAYARPEGEGWVRLDRAWDLGNDLTASGELCAVAADADVCVVAADAEVCVVPADAELPVVAAEAELCIVAAETAQSSPAYGS